MRKKPVTYACASKACGHDDLTPDETWDCADCCRRFCDEHINDIGGAGGTVHVCLHCAVRRQAGKPARVHWAEPDENDREYAA
jgi:hypothetical protein